MPKRKEVDDEFTDSGIRSLGNVTFEELHRNAEESCYDTESELKSFLAQQVADKIEGSVPRLVADAFKERVPKLLSDTLKNILPQIIKDSVKHALLKFDKRVKNSLNAEIPELLIKPLNNAFNLLNKKEHNMFFSLQKLLDKTIKIKVDKSVLRSVRKEVTVVRELLKYDVNQLDKNDFNLRQLVDLIRDLVVLIDSTLASTKVVPEGEKKYTQENKESVITILAPAQREQKPSNNTPKLKSTKEAKVDAQGEQSSEQAPPISTALVVHSFEEKPTEDEPVFKKLRPLAIINMPMDQFTDSLFNTTSSEFSPTLLKDDKGMGVASKKDPLKESILLIDEGAKAHMEEIKSLEFLKPEKEKSEKRLKVLTPKQLEAQAVELAAYEAKRAKMLQEYNHFITFKADHLPITKISYMKMPGFSEWVEWVKIQAVKLGIPLPPQLTSFELPPTERKAGMKRKRRIELIHETFVKENIVVDGMQRNLTLPEGVVGKADMVIKEPKAGIFLYNGNFDLVFQRRS
ncbi:hypothetical protein Tco_0379612 [Tanacetum coccineum]